MSEITYDEFGYPVMPFVPEEKKIYTITLDDGTELTDLELNGNNFVSKTPITEEMFEDNMITVTIADNTGHVEKHTNMELLQIMVIGSDYYFIIRDIPEEMIFRMTVMANFDYIAMATGLSI